MTAVLDAGLSRVLAFSPTGEAMSVWPLDTFDMDPAALRGVDDFTPLPLLAGYPAGLAFIYPARDGRRVVIASLAGDGRERAIALTDTQRNGGLALDVDGRLVSVALRAAAGRLFLVVDRESDTGEMRNIALVPNPCGDAVANITLTGFAIAPNGRVAAGLAQTGTPGKCRYDASWLVEGELRDGTFATALAATHQLRLFEKDGSLAPRYRAQKGATYPVPPCIPLFTALAFADDAVVTGGHPADPFLRAYGTEGLRWSVPHPSTGGQAMAAIPAIPDKFGTRLVATTPSGCLDIYTVNGRLTDMFGQPASHSLANTIALAADANSVYAATRAHDGYRLVRFAADGRVVWSRPIVPPAQMSRAMPSLCAPTGDCVWIGWRQPDTLGLGWVDVVMEDGVAADPLWKTPFVAIRAAPDTPQPPAPMLRGADGKAYVLREMDEGTRLLAFSATGPWVRSLPALDPKPDPLVDKPVPPLARLMAPLAAVTADGSCMVPQPNDRVVGGPMGIATYAPDGARTGWRRIFRPSDGATFTPISATAPWGWLDTTQTLLKLGLDGSVLDERDLRAPTGDRIDTPMALAGNGHGHIYVATLDAILVGTL
jgi:hypothetical protein